MHKILIAGGSGFIGSYLYNTFNEEYSVTTLGREWDQFKPNYYSLDLANVEKVKTFVENSPEYDILIFLVGLAHKKGKKEELGEFEKTNKQSLINLISKMQEYKKLPDKIIFSSTISVYGEDMNTFTYDEESKNYPLSPYAITKLEAEKYLKDITPNNLWILRLAPVYAKNFQLNLERRTKIGGFFYKVGDGHIKLSLCNLDNIGNVINSIIMNKVPAGTYNISDRIEYTYNDLLRYMRADRIIQIPLTIAKGFYLIGKILNIIFLKENVTKLVSDNIYPSNKIRQFVKFTAILKND